MTRRPYRRQLAMCCVAALAVVAGVCAAIAATTAGDVPLPELERMTLPNGLRVVLIEQRRAPLVAAALVTGAGAAQDPEGKEGLASLVGGVLRRGTVARDAQAFAAATELLAGEIDVEVDYDTTTVTASFLARDAGVGLGLLAEMVLEPGFRRDEIERERRDLVAAVRAAQEDPSALASLCFARFLDADHPYGRPVDGGPVSLERLGRSDVRDFYDAYYRPNGAVLVVVGAVPLSELAADTRAAFGAWQPGRPVPPAPPDPRPVTTRRILVVDKPGTTQAHIRVGNVGLTRRDPNYLVARLANTALGGGFTSRLMQELRVRRSLTYGAWSSFTSRRARGDFRIGTFTKVETLGETVRLILAELERYRSAPPDADEVGKARAYSCGQLPLRLQAPDALAVRVAEIEWYGLALDEITAFCSLTTRITPEDLAAFIRGEVPSADAVAIVVVGPAARVLPALEGLGPVTVVPPAYCLGAASG